MSEPSIDAKSLVGVVMDSYPGTLAVFVRRRMLCPGCVMAPFMTLADVAGSYSVDCEALLCELRAAALTTVAGGRP